MVRRNEDRDYLETNRDHWMGMEEHDAALDAQERFEPAPQPPTGLPATAGNYMAVMERLTHSMRDETSAAALKDAIDLFDAAGIESSLRHLTQLVERAVARMRMQQVGK